MTPAGPIVVDKFGGSVLTRPEDVAAAVEVVVRQRAAGLRPVVVVSAFEGVTDAILSSASVLLPDGGASLRGDAAHAPDSALARETDRALATGEALSAALFALGLEARGIPARSFSGAEAGIRTAAAHLGAAVRRVYSRPLRTAVAEGLVPVVAGFQGIGAHGELTTLGRGGTDLSAVALAVALRADRCELFKDTGGVWEADPHLVPEARLLAVVDALQLELLGELGAEVVHPVAVRRARRGRLRLVVRSLDDEAPSTEVLPRSPRGADGAMLLAVDRKERIARISLIGPALRMPELLPLPAHGEGSFDEGGLRVVWAEVPVARAAQAAQAVHAALMA
jgi:aspartate kinase